MRLATIRTDNGTRAVRIDETVAVELGPPDLVEVLREPDWENTVMSATGVHHELDGLQYAPVVVRPEKIICVGQNYRQHIVEMGGSLPEFPTLFAKYPAALIGAYDDIVLPTESQAIDWEAELGIIIGAPVRHADSNDALDAIAGYTVLNDISARDWQFRTPQWLQGKTFEATTPLGPCLVTDDAKRSPIDLHLFCEVDGEIVQSSSTVDLVFDPVTLIRYISMIMTLRPGDVIATGTPGGVGHAREPRRYLQNNAVLVTGVDGLGECRNKCRRISPSSLKDSFTLQGST